MSIWTGRPLVLWHGTDVESARRITENQIDFSYSRKFLDFGPGFYTTTRRSQASLWAERLRFRGKLPILVRISVTYDDFSVLHTLSFADGSRTADEFWEFVIACRSSSHPHRAEPKGWFDAVVGPVATVWQSRVAKQVSDQISFHSVHAEDFLNRQQRSVEVL